MAFVVKAALLASDTEGLAGAASGPDGSIIGPTGEAECEGPSADAGEEMTLRVTGQVGRSKIDN
jgi:hypothetical protein